MALHKGLGLHEHPARAAARVIDPPLEGPQHLDQHADDGTRGVELAAALAFGPRKPAQKVLVNPAQHVARPLAGFARGDAGHEVDQFAQHDFVEGRAVVVFGQHAFEAGVRRLDGGHRVVDQFSDGRLPRARLQVGPAGLLGHPEHVLGAVLVRIFSGGLVFRQQGRPLRLEGVGDVLEEDQAERDMLVVRRFEILPQLVSREEHLRLEPQRCAVAIALPLRRGGVIQACLRTSAWHSCCVSLGRDCAPVASHRTRRRRPDLRSKPGASRPKERTGLILFR